MDLADRDGGKGRDLVLPGSTRRLWRAVMTRDAQQDGLFVYAVRSTGIYCRPSCPARRPRRQHVIFFSAPEAAEHAGFRACRRCRPREGRHNQQAELIARVCSSIEARTDGPPPLAALAAETEVGASHLRAMFIRVLGVTPRGYGDAVRIRRLKSRLRQGDNVAMALYEAGYGSASRLYEGVQRKLGMTPASYRKGGRGMEIGYTITNCPLGRLLVAGTRHGISATYLGDADAPLEAALHKEYPQARLRRDRAKVSRWVQQIVRHLAGGQPQLRLPLDIAATAFQRRVWEALLRIPYGATRSYSEISRDIGRPKAARAVARACATNPVSVVIPCHRVVGKDEGLRGYRWGIERKQALLALEGRSGKNAAKKEPHFPGRRKEGKKVNPAA
jgi:AraC family transcriptional regulator, regulatory protein of adaptative response / methylated-DNA-[protein]-cysteine methyltransferase